MAGTGAVRGRLISRTCGWLAALALLGACSEPDPQAPYRDYLDRLGTTLGAAPTASVSGAFPRPPRSGALRIELSSSKLDTLDFLALSGCDLQVTIGKVNSSLGRMARDSQKLLLSLEYLRLAPACIDRLLDEDRDSLAATLAEAQELKRRQLPALIFNATLGADEYRAFWLPGRQPGQYPAVGSSRAGVAAAAIDARVRQWLAGDYTADDLAFELELGDIAGGGGGAVLADLLRQQQWLAQADALVSMRLERGPLCGPSLRHTAADTLPVVVRRFFVAGIQPRAATMNSRQYELMPPVQSLEQQLAGVLPDNYRQWMAARETALETALSAPRHHVRQLEKILAPCGGAQAPPPTAAFKSGCAAGCRAEKIVYGIGVARARDSSSQSTLGS